MVSIETLFGIVCTEGVEGGARDHYFDTERNREFVPPEPERAYQTDEARPIRYDLEFIRRPDGSIEIVE
jgi:hypothetical protein